MPPKQPPSPAFQSPEELQELLRFISGRLHYLNRVAIGESRFAWQLADLIKASGDLAPLLKDASVQAEFGDGWTEGTVPRDRLGQHIRDMLAGKMSD